jgi:Uma2 family endonuclease
MSTIDREDLPHYTYDDYLLWEGKWELINGIAYAMTPAPTVEHQRISQNIAHDLVDSLDNCKQCQALLPVDWKISEDTVVQPDNLVICYPAEGAYLTKAPTLIFEILSRSSAQKDRNTKYEIYAKEGVKYYVIVDPVDHLAKVYELASGQYRKLVDASNDKVEFNLGPCRIRLDFGKIWV